MADQSNGAPGRGDQVRSGEPDRPRAARGPSLAEDASDDLPALLVIAVGIAVIVVLLLQSGARIPGLTPEPVVAGVAADDEAEAAEPEEDAEEEVEEEPEALDQAELEATQAELATALVGAGFDGVSLSLAGGVVTATGEVADEAGRAQVIALLEGLPGVEGVVDQLTIAEATSAEVTVTASQATLLLAGTVPSQAIADELTARALAIYAPDQIDNQLVVDESAAPPIVVTVTGSMTDQALFDSLTRAFTGIVGIDNINTDSLQLQESNELETSLLALPPIEFDSGSAVILPASATILDQVALLLASDTSVAIEIGGHTDSRGSDESNQSLSQARAESVLAALIERGVLNEMSPRGFGESRLKVDPETTPEDQQANRRIEFRILN